MLLLFNVISRPVSALFKLKWSHMRSTAPMSIYFNINETGDSYNKFKDHHPRLYVIGNGSRLASKCVFLKQSTARILFNCGESADFKGVADSVFVTHIGWDKIGGIPSVIYKASSSMREQLSFCGPPGLDCFIQASESFLMLHKKLKVNILNPKLMHQNIGDNYKVTCVPIRSNTKVVYRPSPINNSMLKSFNGIYNPYSARKPNELITSCSKDYDFNVSNSYIVESGGCKNWRFSQCVLRGVQPGEQMLKLWQGESITVEDGSIVKPEDVISFNSCSSVIVIDCPSENFLDDLLSKEDYERYYDSSVVMVHFTPLAVMEDKRYITWMQRFKKNTKHVVVNDSNEWESSPRVLNKQKICRSIHPRFYPELQQRSKDQTNISASESLEKLTSLDSVDGTLVVNAVPSEEWLQKWSDEMREFDLVQSQTGLNVNLKGLECTRHFEPFEISCLPDETKYGESLKTPPTFSPKNPRITFLGTGSQASSAYRNASAILVQISSDSSMLIDCGDGTIKQFVTLFNDSELLEVLTSLRCIYISHTHADHHAGVIGVLLAIQKAWKALGKPQKNIVCLLPAPIIGWLHHYHTYIEPILDHVVLINLVDMMSDNIVHRRELNQFFKNHYGMINTKVCWAIHSTYSYCVSFEHSAGWQISYSGDTRYNHYFVEMGRNSDLLIHEATYGSGLDKMAKIARHSTTEDAIRAGKAMRAKNIILTHFSRRYPIIPCLGDLKNTENVAVAMDFLQVTLDDLHLLPKLHEDYEVVFDMYEQKNVDRNKSLKKRNS
ncbi:zinc phosphodiesterase ELAC protein 2-like [Thrips palmi]|uniref:ribonuclease Z n=1 Tax=Thrips palmi TaxID=161013 RepID=A0A6P8Z0R5_THRPL|nr:zinc phosphodiesterase ELAC protein 2-like [Thrips palmi]